MAAEVPREQMSNPQYWRNLCPGLALRNQKDKRAAWPSDVALPEAAHVCADRSEWEKAQKRLKQDGFASLPPTAISWSKDWPKLLGEAAEELGVAGWPPTALCHLLTGGVLERGFRACMTSAGSCFKMCGSLWTTG